MKLEKTPEISVGILKSNRIRFFLKGTYCFANQFFQDVGGVAVRDADTIRLSLEGKTLMDIEECKFIAQGEDAEIIIHEVIIGVNFHWERKEDQTFKGDLKLIKEGELLTAVNVLPLEDYLESVIASEMSATASEALLKSHAVISRSWLLAQLLKQEKLSEKNYQSTLQTKEELVKWYDREDHKYYDVCADDHCQRYQGITRIGTPKAIAAVKATRGEVLLYDGKVCDARFSKCCGGVVESFENVWEPEKKAYLLPLYDADNESLEGFDLTCEMEATAFIKEKPKAFCNTTDAKVLAEVLNDYDQETTDFYRWQKRYTVEELSSLVKERTGTDYGEIIDLQPVERGYSGRLKRLRIVGAKRTQIIGKELEIRKTLSKSHLYSSAFIIEREGTDFILKGAGWGHGVGLCQMGAAVMGVQGYKYKDILHHYFKNVSIQKIYE